MPLYVLPLRIDQVAPTADGGLLEFRDVLLIQKQTIAQIVIQEGLQVSPYVPLEQPHWLPQKIRWRNNCLDHFLV